MRRLREKLPEGWRTEWDEESTFRRAGVIANGSSGMGPPYKDSVRRVWNALKAAPIPEGWLPDGPDDPILVELFRQHWHE